MKQMALIVATLGLLSFIFGVVAENKKVTIRMFVWNWYPIIDSCKDYAFYNKEIISDHPPVLIQLNLFCLLPSFNFWEFLHILLLLGEWEYDDEYVLQPATGTATTIPGKDVTICKYKSDPFVALGYLSVVFLAASTVMGYLSLLHPYQGRSIPQSALFQNTRFFIFFNISV